MHSTNRAKLTQLDRTSSLHSLTGTGEPAHPILVCLLGEFRLLKAGHPVSVSSGGKSEALLCSLALGDRAGISREAILEAIWPGSEVGLAGQSLNSLVYSLHKLLGEAIGGAAPVIYQDGRYRLNREAGVGVDLAHFDALATAGAEQRRAGRPAEAMAFYERAVTVYRGDLCVGPDIRAVLERERLRALYLNLLAQLADHHYDHGDYAACLAHALRLLASDPCREDAHRQVMRCYARRGERAQALRQYRLCESILHREFDAVPEAATTALFDQLRLNPDSI